MNWMSDFLKNYSASARAGLLVGGALILLGLAAALWWLLSPSYQLLFGDLREGDAAEITQSLNEWKVPYRFTEGGSGIEVPADQVYDTRMKLVSAGVPSGGHVGFELFNDSDFGVTEFAQRVNYQRAVQGELERSIAALPGVQSVRVHLTIRRPGLFVGQDDSSKASVVVAMAPGEALVPTQVRGIRNLVASAVEGLSPAAVVVLGPGGVLQGGSSGGEDSLMRQNEEQTGYESRVRERVSDLLSQVFKLRDFRVSVDARLNFDQVRKVSERLLEQGEGGNGLVTRKRVSRSGAAVTADASEKPATQSQEEFDYAHGSEREEVVRAPGRVERLSIAVLVPPSLSAAELERLRKLITAAAGLDSERGDRLEIGSISEGAVANPRIDDNVVLVPGGNAPQLEATDAVPAVAGRTRSPLLWAGIAAVLGLLLGWLFARLSRPSPPTLRTEERDAVLVKLRTWLADGGTAV
jgi:flagellar M-ring protein FliF